MEIDLTLQLEDAEPLATLNEFGDGSIYSLLLGFEMTNFNSFFNELVVEF
jgi:hypothetical protein